MEYTKRINENTTGQVYTWKGIFALLSAWSSFVQNMNNRPNAMESGLLESIYLIVKNPLIMYTRGHIIGTLTKLHNVSSIRNWSRGVI